MKKLFNIWFIAFVVMILLGSYCLAFDFQINKAKVRVKLPPGWSDGDVIMVENKDDKSVTIRVYISDWVYTDQHGAKNFMPPGTHSMSAAEWVKFYPADLTIPPKSRQEVRYVVQVPPDAAGGHYAVLFFEVGAGEIWDEPKGVMVNVYNRLGSLFYIEPEGTIIREANVSDFQISSSTEGYEAEVLFQNIGNVDITGQGNLDIIDAEGFVFARGRFPDVYTMPQDKAKLSLKDSSVNFAKGVYDAILTFDLDGNIVVKEYQIEVSDSGQIISQRELE